MFLFYFFFVSQEGHDMGQVPTLPGALTDQDWGDLINPQAMVKHSP